MMLNIKTMHTEIRQHGFLTPAIFHRYDYIKRRLSELEFWQHNEEPGPLDLHCLYRLLLDHTL